MVDKARLVYEMNKKNLTQEEFSRLLGQSVSTVNRKINDKVSFTLDDVHKIRKILDLSEHSMIEIFFDTKNGI